MLDQSQKCERITQGWAFEEGRLFSKKKMVKKIQVDNRNWPSAFVEFEGFENSKVFELYNQESLESRLLMPREMFGCSEVQKLFEEAHNHL